MKTASDFIKTAGSIKGAVDELTQGAKKLYKSDISPSSVKGWFKKTWEDASGKNYRRAASKYGNKINEQARQKEAHAKGLARADRIQAAHDKKRSKGMGKLLPKKSPHAERIRAEVLKQKKTNTMSNKAVRLNQKKIDLAKRNRNVARLKLGGGAVAVGGAGVGTAKALSSNE